MGHSVGDAAARSTAKSFSKEKQIRTTEQVIKDIRNHLDAKLAITPGDVSTLLAEYDRLTYELMPKNEEYCPETLQE